MALKISNLSKSFGTTVIFDSFNLDLPDTGIVAVTGRSGVGKTTLLRIISGLDKDFRGEITGGGIKAVSFAFQEYRLFPHLNALQNVLCAVTHPNMDDEIEAASLLYKLGFTYRELTLRPDELSGGMKQRVSLARAILKKTPILILDEPTKEMDDGPILALYSLLREIGRERLIVFTSHNTRDIEELAEKVIEL